MARGRLGPWARRQSYEHPAEKTTSMHRLDFSYLTRCRFAPVEHIKDFLQTFKSVLTEADVEETGMEVDGAPQLKYFKQLVRGPSMHGSTVDVGELRAG